jgi:hypothetical protein
MAKVALPNKAAACSIAENVIVLTDLYPFSEDEWSLGKMLTG